MAGTRSPVPIVYLDESIGFLVPSFLRPDGSGPSSLRSGLSSLRPGLSSPTYRFITVCANSRSPADWIGCCSHRSAGDGRPVARRSSRSVASSPSGYAPLRMDYCSFGRFCRIPTNLLLFISLLKVLICIIYQ